MFFIGDTFYCDFRDTLNKDYGEVIDQWAQKNPQMNLGPFKHKAMEQTVIADLEFRLGYPYVFMHLGSCEHLITFVDARYCKFLHFPYPTVSKLSKGINFA